MVSSFGFNLFMYMYFKQRKKLKLIMISFCFLSFLERDFKKHDDRNWNRRDAGRGRGRGGPMMYVLDVWFSLAFLSCPWPAQSREVVTVLSGSFLETCSARGRGGGGWDSHVKKSWDVHRQIWIKLVRETNLGMA